LNRKPEYRAPVRPSGNQKRFWRDPERRAGLNIILSLPCGAQKGQNPAHELPRNEIAILVTLFAMAVALADDFKTTNGKEYKDATVTHVEPDGIVIKTKSGISKIYFLELPQEVQQKFNYDPQTAAAYSAQQVAALAATQNQAQRQQPAAGPNVPNGGEIQATVNAIHGLQGRLAQIQSDEAMLEQRIHEMERWHLGRLERADLENLRRQLVDLRHEEREVKSQLNQLQKAQR
jgi:hypothetical protein